MPDIELPASTPDVPTGPDGFFARLFQSDAPPRALDDRLLGAHPPSDSELLWVDLEDPSDELLHQVWQTCGFPDQAMDFVEGGTTPGVGQAGDCFWVRCVAINDQQQKELMSGVVLVCVARPNRVVTLHRGEVEFLSELRHTCREVVLGGMCAESFVATVLDRQLAGYFQAVSDYEGAIEHLEVEMLDRAVGDNIAELQRLRRWASRLRRMLAPHRNVFGVMSRPDFRHSDNTLAARHFVALDTRFERAMDMVENARDLVIGSFELFSSQTALRTSDSMRMLTFVTVITGLMATFVGALGMNFDASFFQLRDGAFWLVIGGLFCFALGAFTLGKARRWF